MQPRRFCALCSLLLLLLLATPRPGQGKTLSKAKDDGDAASKQLLFGGGAGKETSQPNFVRLVVMRLIYGLASTMGVEERLEGVLNGVFVPPNADEGDLFGFGGAGAGDGGGLFGGGGGDDLLDGIFSDDY